MTKTTDHQTAWRKFSGTVIAIANGGAMFSAVAMSIALLIAAPVFAQGEGNQVTIRFHEMQDVGQEIEDELREVEDELNEVALEVQEALDEIGLDTGIKIHINDHDGDSRPKMGVYLSNMDFEDAYKMRYPFAHGVLVNGIVNNGNADKAGIIEDDIIMYFGESKVLYEDHLVRLIRSKKFGDQVQVIFWRDEAQDTTVVTFVQPEKKEKDKQLAVVGEDKKKERRNSRGYGGGGFTPMFVQDDFKDLGDLMTSLGLEGTPLSDEGVVMWGGSGQGYVGNGWFLGGFGNFGGLDKNVKAAHSDSVTIVKRKVTLSMGYGGLTVEKRLAPFSWMVISGGVGLGFGGIDLNVTQDDGEFSWDNINDELIDTKSTVVNFSKNYAIAHPRASVMLKLTGWMRLRAEYGYLYGYGFSDGWNTTLGNSSIEPSQETFELTGSTDKLSELGASTVSVGLWFGF